MAKKIYIPDKENIELVMLDIDDLEIDGLSISSSQAFGKTSWKPSMKLILDGKTINVVGMGEMRTVLSGMLQREVDSEEIVESFNITDWEKTISRYKDEMRKRDIQNVRFRVDTTYADAKIFTATGLKREQVNSVTMVDYLSAKLKEHGVKKSRPDVIITEDVITVPNKEDKIIRNGYNLVDVDKGFIAVTPFVEVGDERFEFGTTNIFASQEWKDDIGEVVVKDIELIENIVDNASINSRIKLNLDDKKLKKLEKSLLKTMSKGDVVLPKEAISELMVRFKSNIQKYCHKSEFSGSAVCVDMALNKSIKPNNFPLEMEKKLRKILVDFPGDEIQ